VASTFLHAGFAHVAMNALSLLMFGAALEAMFAPGAFAIVYVFGGAAASAGSLAWHTSRHGAEGFTSVGGSGAVFALGGALLAAAIQLRGRLAVGRARALGAGALFLLVQSLTAGFAKVGTDNAAHASGLVAGVLIGLLLPVSPALGGRTRTGGVTAISFVATLVALAALGYSVAHGVHSVW
jgi:rhomboid protease GluP